MREGLNIYQELEIDPNSELADGSLDELSIKEVGNRMIISIDTGNLDRESAIAYIEQIKDEVLGEARNGKV